MLPILTVVKNCAPKHLAIIQSLLEDLIKSRKELKGETLQGEIIEGIRELEARALQGTIKGGKFVKFIPTSDLVELLNTDREQYPFSPKKISNEVKKLGFEVTRSSYDNKSCIVLNDDLLKRLSDEYGINSPNTPSLQNPSVNFNNLNYPDLRVPPSPPVWNQSGTFRR